MCSKNCINIVIIIFIVYIVVAVVCQNRQMNGANKCKHKISDSKDYFLFECFSKESFSCSKVGAAHV